MPEKWKQRKGFRFKRGKFGTVVEYDEKQTKAKGGEIREKWRKGHGSDPRGTDNLHSPPAT